MGSSESGCARWALETWPVWWHLDLHPGSTYLNEMLHTSLFAICLFFYKSHTGSVKVAAIDVFVISSIGESISCECWVNG